MTGRDTIVHAQSGTGMTTAFCIGVLQSVDIAVRRPQALILAPTRELALQIQKVVIALGDYLKCQCHACVGGTSVREDMSKLDGKLAQVVDRLQRVSIDVFLYRTMSTTPLHTPSSQRPSLFSLSPPNTESDAKVETPIVSPNTTMLCSFQLLPRIYA